MSPVRPRCAWVARPPAGFAHPGLPWRTHQSLIHLIPPPHLHAPTLCFCALEQSQILKPSPTIPQYTDAQLFHTRAATGCPPPGGFIEKRSDPSPSHFLPPQTAPPHAPPMVGPGRRPLAGSAPLREPRPSLIQGDPCRPGRGKVQNQHSQNQRMIFFVLII